MRQGKIVKGVCSECGRSRAFQLQETRVHTTTVHIAGVLVGRVQPLRISYRGVCSRGHDVNFYLIKSGLNPGRFPRRTATEKYFKFWMPNNKDILLRGESAVAGYRAWLAGFRKPRREAHYKKDHECDMNCPEYDWPDEYWGDYE